MKTTPCGTSRVIELGFMTLSFAQVPNDRNGSNSVRTNIEDCDYVV